MSTFYKIAIILVVLFVLYQIEGRSNAFTKIWTSAVKRKVNIVPDGVNLLDYPLLLDANSESGFEITDVDSYGTGDTGGPYPTNDFTVLRFLSETYDLEFIILDKNGDIHCKIEPQKDLRLAGDYLVFIDGYYSLVADDCSKVQQYADYKTSEADKKNTIKKLYEESATHIEYSYIDFERDSDNYENERNRHVFFHKGRWIKIDYAPSAGYLKYKVSGGSGFIEGDIKGDDADVKTMGFLGGRAKITLDYFEKTKYEKARKAGFANPSGTSASAFWYGTGYYTLEFDGCVLNFKLERVKSWGNLRVFGKDSLNFIILEKIVPGNWSNHFIIKPKQ